MPVEVRELIIKATITQDGNSGGNGEASGSSTKPNEALIRECVEKVMEIIRSKNER